MNDVKRQSTRETFLDNLNGLESVGALVKLPEQSGWLEVSWRCVGALVKLPGQSGWLEVSWRCVGALWNILDNLNGLESAGDA